MKRVSAFHFAAALVLFGAVSADAADTVNTQELAVRVDKLADGLEHPWAVEVLPDGAYLVTERPGRMRIVRDGKVSDPIDGVPKVSARGQGGLMDVALAPDFATSRKLYFTAAIANRQGSGTEAFSATLSTDEKTLDAVTPIFSMRRFTSGNIQYGSRIAISGDGTLFISVGDRGNRDRSQNWQDDAGSIIHISADGSIPAGNPFKDGGKALPEIWSKGHRNPQGIAFDAKDGKLYTVEHGARGGDEINQPEAGKNYGWPIISYGRNYSGSEIGEGTAKKGLEQPLHYWDPSIAPGALVVYRGAMFPEWDGNFLVAALKFQLLSRMQRDETGAFVAEERLFKGEYGRIRDVVVAPDGALLMVTDENNGALLRISRAQARNG
ncbi:PQQ-dependent sugar dehydrogenase [Rhizobium leguminosarum]|uniref:PQQ-dependent sugar dehydrogenase n=1 Tax=Rhizobium leguminosarum TaxID=384 RepID=A0AAJ1EHM8_RHILE|nr:PQQ-dependent sugar dehydrogenase [Rhizobium leguminosarum]MBY5537271.1 PQQ-dependent sugar dehydrogenase [Rhizobium leguminosarum]MBY5598216.1 PQQ-dependent sugar dehydrogenase [Rhizobium leguminosarum]MBY5618259.1 PQQ-dependent sugar dehydrogenase [Rhizobium leguminosarum]MBY5632107.1 PQQ-dependent sugar dehydrogenase [Rhizobium leguminosarum]MBY5734202.1 PQQ-dependent sugar dehydrogenase [Rhizobium leguminosarum]